MGENLPARGLAFIRNPLCIDRDDDALRAELLRSLAHEFSVLDRSRHDRNLVSSGLEKLSHVGDAAHAAADSQRHEAAFGGLLDDIEDDVPVLMRRGDIEKTQFVRASGVIGGRGFHRIAGIAQVDEVDTLDDAAVLHVQARDYAGF